LQRRIGVDQVRRVHRLPGRDVAQLEADLRQALARAFQHRGGVVGAKHFRGREALDEQLRGIARAAAQVHHAAGLVQRHAGEQFARRARALVLEPPVQRGVPVTHLDDTLR
jgi:type II secretory pathway component PulJ